jgi:hypothetical protein
MTRWSRALLMLLLSVTLTAAPCAHCLMASAPASDPAHDCCPKQKQDAATSECGWMPAQYVAPEGLTPGVELAVTALAPAATNEAMALPPVHAFIHTDETPPLHSPPLYLTQAALLI